MSLEPVVGISHNEEEPEIRNSLAVLLVGSSVRSLIFIYQAQYVGQELLYPEWIIFTVSYFAETFDGNGATLMSAMMSVFQLLFNVGYGTHWFWVVLLMTFYPGLENCFDYMMIKILFLYLLEFAVKVPGCVYILLSLVRFADFYIPCKRKSIEDLLLVVLIILILRYHIAEATIISSVAIYALANSWILLKSCLFPIRFSSMVRRKFLRYV